RLEGGQVRLGIDAPREVAVVRAELVSGRQLPGDRAAHRRPGAALPTDIKHRPDAVHEIDNRRRGRFR
ncbi:MAG: carbon storage regulator, partial [Isosphaeraceae bacterium]